MWWILMGFAVGFVLGATRRRVLRAWRELTSIDASDVAQALYELSDEELKIIRKEVEELLSK